MNQQTGKGNIRGSAMVEMALVLPVLVVLVVGLVEFSRVLMVQQVITNAAREGARAGSLYFNDADAVEHATQVSSDYLTASGVNLGLTTISPSFMTMSDIPAVRMQIDYVYTTLITSFLPGIPATFQMSTAATMRREL